MIEHQLHRLLCPHCPITTCAALPAGVESGGFGPHSQRKVRSLLDQVLGVELSTGAINAIRCRLSESLAPLVEEAAEALRQDKGPPPCAPAVDVFSAGARALGPAVIHRKVSHGVQSQRVRSANANFSP
ncbi:MAG: hypothetical protein ACK6BG_00985 [Cyanobacteriota bacterium]